MKIVTILLLFVAATLFAADSGLRLENRCVGDINRLSTSQKMVLLKAYQYGESYDLGYTLAAIAWVESCAGEYRMNFQDPSAGVFHTYIPGIFDRHPQLKRNGFTENQLGEMLIRDMEFSAKETISELKYWRKVHGNNWERMVKSYNKGNSWQRSAEAALKAEIYLESVQSKMYQLRKNLKDIDRELRSATKDDPMNGAELLGMLQIK